MSLLVSSGGGGGTSGPVAAADITDAGTAGIAVLQAETPAQAFAAIGPAPQYTAAQLAALTEGNRPPVAYCTDCLVPEGVGAFVFWTGSAWVCTCSMFPVVTEWIDYFRAEFARAGGVTNSAGFNVHDSFVSTGLQNLFVQSGQNSGVIDIVTGGNLPAVFARFGASTANWGARAVGLPNTGYPAGKAKAQYFRAYIAVSHASDATNAYSLRFGFSDVASFSIRPVEFGLALDSQNVLGALNAGGVGSFIAYSRKASVNTYVNASAQNVSTSLTSPTLLEVLLVGTSSVKCYVSGVEVGSTTSAPAATDALIPHIIAVRSAGDGSERYIYSSRAYRSVKY